MWKIIQPAGRAIGHPVPRVRTPIVVVVIICRLGSRLAHRGHGEIFRLSTVLTRPHVISLIDKILSIVNSSRPARVELQKKLINDENGRDVTIIISSGTLTL